MHLLIVDDDRDAAQTLAELLALLVGSIQIELAYDGIEAVAAATAKNMQFDAVITDIEMPRMDGFTAANLIKSALGDKAPVLIALTGRVGIPRHPAVNETFDHVLLKPLKLDALVTLLLALPKRPEAPPE